MKWKTVLILGLLAFSGGCVPVVSKTLLKEAQTIPFRELSSEPEEYKGKTVILGGIILDVKVEKEKTILEVLQVPASPYERPKDMEKSEGRFIVEYPSFLDPAIYTKGKAITVGGVVKGKEVGKIGERELVYPLIEGKEIYLWPVEEKEMRCVFEGWPSVLMPFPRCWCP
jgi:outer membrane lipoprotein